MLEDALRGLLLLGNQPEYLVLILIMLEDALRGCN